MNNIILIGMPGAGKSTIGVVLAKTLGMAFVDTDLEIQKREGRLLQSILEEDGISRFLEIEENVIMSRTYAHHVVSTGGSVVKSPMAMRYLKESGCVIYLRLDYRSIRRRIRNITTRGIVMSRDQTLRDIYCEREPLYERYADYTCDCRGRSVEQIVYLISAIFRKALGES